MPSLGFSLIRTSCDDLPRGVPASLPRTLEEFRASRQEMTGEEFFTISDSDHFPPDEPDARLLVYAGHHYIEILDDGRFMCEMDLWARCTDEGYSLSDMERDIFRMATRRGAGADLRQT